MNDLENQEFRFDGWDAAAAGRSGVGSVCFFFSFFVDKPKKNKPWI